MKIKLLVIVLVALALLTVPAFAKNIAVGEFALKYAQSLGIRVASTQDAFAALTERGLIDRGLKAESMLTEKDLSDILERAGIRASTSNPANVVDETVADSVISSLSAAPGSDNPSSTTNSTGGSADDANNNGMKTRPKGQTPNSRANPNAFYGREDEG